ncbi:MAG TPA: hypothetical protein VGA64_06820 [Candidatus Polarisedimenticolia bacterium]
MTPFTGIVGQPRAVTALGALMASDRVSPSLILHGPIGVGKLPTALAVARAFLCSSASGRPCGRCASCRRIDERNLIHPDIRIAFPEKLADFEKGKTTEGASGVDPQELQAEAIANPAWNLLIDRIRQGIAFVQRRPSEGTRSFLIVDQAHRMPAEAANALLKTLEEPPPHAVIILITSSLHALLPTLRSRCQAIPFQLVPRDAIAEALVRRGGIDAEEALLRAGLAFGRIGAALDLDLGEFRERREILLRILETLLKGGDPGLAVARAEEIARGGDSVESDLETLFGLLRDLMILAATPSAAGGVRLVHVDLPSRLAPLAERLGEAGPAAVVHLETTIEAIRRKGNRQMLIENLFLGLLPAAGAAAPRGAA